MGKHVRIDPAQGAIEKPATGPGACVCERMSRPAVVVSADAPIIEALRLMKAHRIHYLPVVNADARLVGIVNSDDLLGTRRPSSLRPDNLVAAVMNAPTVSIGPQTPLAEAARLMADRQIGALPVVTDGRVIGILSQSDVVRAVACQELP
jgi:CBS domain-containing protein